jgi:hypothetical protein
VDIGNVPSTLAGLIMAVMFPLMVEGGYRLHRHLKKFGVDSADAGGAGYIVSAAIGLLGLLIGFTFAMSSDRYETRRGLVIQEANSISTAWQLQQMLPKIARDRLAPLMRRYVEERRAFGSAGTDKAQLDVDWARTDGLQQHIWGIERDNIPSLNTSLGVMLLGSTQTMFTLAATRRAAVDSEVPNAIIAALGVSALMSAGLMGYGLSAGGQRHAVASTGLFLLVALAITLIFDLEQPRTGAIQVSQVPLERVAAQILAATAAPTSR